MGCSEAIEPEVGESGEDSALVGDQAWEDPVVCRDTIRGDE